MQLQLVYNRFVHRLDRLEEVFTNWVAGSSGRPTQADVMFLEGLLSTLWQQWSLFCRRVVFESAMGCVTRSGITVAPCVAPVDWKRVSYLSWRAYSGGAVQPGLLNSDLKKEPTWGDVQRLPSIISLISPANMSHLLSSLGAITRGPIHLQTVRNASSHRNYQTWDDIMRLKVFYNSHSVKHPSEVSMWVEPTSSDFAFMSWLDEIRLIADIMTN